MQKPKDVYVSSKRVTTSPMTRREYNHYRGWQLPLDEDGSEEGYLIEDLTGMPNHPSHKGYVSWIPKAQFESNYSLEPVSTKDRAQLELDELVRKLAKLSKFIENKQPVYIGDYEWSLLVSQQSIMSAYVANLGLRLKLM